MLPSGARVAELNSIIQKCSGQRMKVLLNENMITFYYRSSQVLSNYPQATCFTKVNKPLDEGISPYE
jgi:hypothetical protein